MRLFCLFCLFISSFSFGAEAYFVEGYMGPEQIGDLEEKLKKDTASEIAIIVQSNGGSFFDVLRFCQKVQKRREEGVKVTMLVDKRAIGPAAFLPFLADTLYVTPESIWGNIPYGLDQSIPREVLMDAARGIIPPGPNQREKEQIAEAMVNPYSQVAGTPFTSDPLILSSEQIIALHYAKSIDSLEEFLALEHALSFKGDATLIGIEQVKNIITPKDLESSLETTVRFNPNGDSSIGYIRYDTPLSKTSYLKTKFALHFFRTIPVAFIVLDINAAGGDIFSAIQMVDLLEKTDANHHIPILTYINGSAIGAAALIPYASRYIIADAHSVFGGMNKKSSEKMYAALTPEFIRTASFWGRNTKIAEAMVNPATALVLRQHEIVSVGKNDTIITSGIDPDIVLSKKGELLTLRGEQLYNLGIASGMVRGQSEISQEDYRNGSWPAEQSPLFTLPYLNTVQNAIMVSYSSWKVTFFSFLTNTFVLAFLFFGLLIGFYLELNTPGFGLMGTIGLLCFALIIWGSATVYTIHWVQWAILGLGLLFFAVELFFIPGFGWTGITGIFFILIALISFSLPTIGALPLFEWDTLRLYLSYIYPQLFSILFGLLAAAVAIYLAARFLSKKVLNLSKLTLHGTYNAPEGYTRLNPDVEMPEIGALGEAFTSLKPSGQVRIGTEIYDAVTQTGFIDRETPVTVVRIEGYKLVVRQVGEDV